MQTIQTPVRLNIPYGCYINEKTEYMDFFDACAVLTSRKQQHYTHAVKEDADHVQLVQHVLVCPFCESRIPAYAHFLHENTSASPLPEEAVSEWASAQISLIPQREWERKKILPLQTPASIPDGWCCPTCENTSAEAGSTLNVSIQPTQETLIITRAVRSLKELLEIRWLSGQSLTSGFPLHERLIFDTEHGCVSLQLSVSDESVLESRCITESLSQTGELVLFDFILKNKSVKAAVKAFFQSHWNHWQRALPFPDEDLTLENLILMTRFIGFPRCFYDAIPFELNSLRVESRFLPIAEKLHKASDVRALLRSSTLPDFRSIRSIFYENPGLIFYLPECERLLQIVGDVNLFRPLLHCRKIFQIVSHLRVYSGTFSYYEDLCRIRGARYLCLCLIQSFTCHHEEAVLYCAMSTEQKQIVQAGWKKGNLSVSGYCGRLYSHMSFSVPMADIPEHIESCTIDGYSFTWLHSSREYAAAGKKLGNCLTDWRMDDNPVAVICEGRRMLAAIEVDGVQVIQARCSHNSCISCTPHLNTAYEKWCSRSGLKKHRAERSFP